jgi:DNA repair exonuclease SbcCD ATPase subunit
MFEGDAMFSNVYDQLEQTNRQHVRLTQQLLGVLDEEQYFAREEFILRRKLAEQRRAEIMAEERLRASTLHHMKCPKCGMQLEEITFSDVRIDKCFSCDGIWLDKGELDVIRSKEGFMERMWCVFR